MLAPLKGRTENRPSHNFQKEEGKIIMNASTLAMLTQPVASSLLSAPPSASPGSRVGIAPLPSPSPVNGRAYPDPSWMPAGIAPLPSPHPTDSKAYPNPSWTPTGAIPVFQPVSATKSPAMLFAAS